MKTALLVAASAAVASASLSESQTQFLFTRFIETHKPAYETKDFFAKYNTFKNNLDTILVHNANPSKTFTMGVTKFADLTAAEFQAQQTLKPIAGALHERAARATKLNYKIPASVDWRTVGETVGPVQDQGQCGSCWAFATSAAAESALVQAGGKFTKFSEQQLVDCAGAEGNHGCNGGLMTLGYQYYAKSGIYETEHYGPYTARDGTCKATASEADIPASRFKDFTVVPQGAEALTAASAAHVVAVALDASSSAFQFYTSGVVTASSCTKNLNHAVLLVGYGTDSSSNLDYYTIRNSWGTGWGDQGYVKIQRGANACGVENHNWNAFPSVQA
jgi:C1A family cysteine protease